MPNQPLQATAKEAAPERHTVQLEGTGAMKLGNDETQILENFRRVASTHVRQFEARRDHVKDLLGPAHNYESGVFREGLLREFLREILPKSLEVSTGFIYGFDEIPTSGQLDVIIWDSSHHAPVYRTTEFVIVPPEAVVSAISVKSDLDQRKTVQEAVANLLSVAPLDLAFRHRSDEFSLPPITKFLFALRRSAQDASVSQWIAEVYRDALARDATLARPLVEALSNVDPLNPSQNHKWVVERVFLKLAVDIDNAGSSRLQGWGPPDDINALLQRAIGSPGSLPTYGPAGLCRLPYLYRQRGQLTTPFEKFIFYVLGSAYRFLGTQGGSVVSAWGDFNPAHGVRVGDAAEIEDTGAEGLLDPDRLAYVPRPNRALPADARNDARA